MTALLDPLHLPQHFADIAELEEFMTRPSAALVADLRALDGDIVILGVGGKMGPTLARLARRAAPDKRILAVARFSEKGLKDQLAAAGIECIQADLADRDAVARLPDVKNVVYMAGRKFGSAGAEHLTWAMNAYVPALVAQRYRDSRIAAFSSGCVYPYVHVYSQGATEATPTKPPPGEYAWSVVARERLFEHFSKTLGTPGRLIRLNYAIDMRYGVLHDIARRVFERKPISVATGHVNVIWQGDANSHVLRALRHCTAPTSGLNVSGPETLSVRVLANAFAARFGRSALLEGSEEPTCWLVNTGEAARLFGYPNVPVGRMIDWVAEWVAAGKQSWDKETHFDVRSGEF
ncbi:MAG: NAD(P)-dependent oxidoreductase [Alphaproteobacteria bacterium]|nr:NAD(P)-dependent oxidoreductase [Alphaproteobacteria bacterium]